MQHRLHSLPYYSATSVKSCKGHLYPIIASMQYISGSIPKGFQPGTHSSGNLNILYNYQEVPLQHEFVLVMSFWLIIYHGNLFSQDLSIFHEF